MVSTSHYYCAHCGAANPPQARFCTVCGQAMLPTRSMSQAVAQAPVPALFQTLVHNHMLKGRYKVIAKVGLGGFGSVYKAADMQFDGRQVAIKEMSQSELTPQEVADSTENFKREAFMLAALQHPNLPSIFDYFTEDGRWYLVMSFIEGETLEEYVRARGGRLTADKVIHIGIQLCAVLNYLHHRNPPIIFRDLKPTNIMRTPERHLYLIDFGVARHFKPGKSKDTMALGSPGYAAPEQYGKAQTTPRTDVYSLGVLLHQLLTGDDPSVMPFSFKPFYTPDYPELAPLIMEMLEMDPNRRPANMNEIRETLKRIAISRPPGGGGRPGPGGGQGGYSPGLGPRRANNRQTPPPPVYLADIAPAQQGQDRARMAQMQQLLDGPQGGQQMLMRPAPAAFAPQPQLRRSSGKLLSRRNVLAGAVGIAAGAGLVAWFVDSRSNQIASQSGGALSQSINPPPVPTMNAIKGQVITTIGGLCGVAWSPDSQRIACGARAGDVAIFQAVASGVGQSGGSTYAFPDVEVSTLAWSPVANSIAVGLSSGIAIMDTETGQTRSMLKLEGNGKAMILSLAWSSDGQMLAAGTFDGRVQVWKVSTGVPIALFATALPIYTVALSPDGRYLALPDAENSIQIFDVDTHKLVQSYGGNAGEVKSIAWSPDGAKIASGGGTDNAIHIWDAPTHSSTSGPATIIYSTRTALINVIAWLPQVNRIAAGTAGGAIQVWEATTGAGIITYQENSSPIKYLSGSIDGTRMVYGSEDGYVVVIQMVQ